MEISGIFTALAIGIIVGALGRLVLPGRQRIGFWLTLLIGIAAALAGTLVAGALGVADTGGIDWIELALQVGFAAAAVALVDSRRTRKAITR
jgi:uncharacterized membrane protein YeaQ/YmgE (transglycosylase-associated protein family)